MTAPAKGKLYSECKHCGNQFATPQASARCGSPKACDRRKAAHDAERKAGLDLTVFKSPGLLAQVKAAEARTAVAPEAEDDGEQEDAEDEEHAGAA
jgi:predicted  nucleic acid-binding Zn-ribbon protein